MHPDFSLKVEPSRRLNSIGAFRFDSVQIARFGQIFLRFRSVPLNESNSGDTVELLAYSAQTIIFRQSFLVTTRVDDCVLRWFAHTTTAEEKNIF